MASVGLSKFVSEAEVEDAKRKRQEEWDRVRQPDDPKTAPEPEPSDMRPLFDRLEEQRLKKEADREESRQLKNLVKGLDSDEVDFLDQVDDLRARHERAQREEERRELEEFKLRTQFARPAVEPEKIEAKKPANSSDRKETNSQAKLLAGAIKRKASEAGLGDGGGSSGDVAKRSGDVAATESSPADQPTTTQAMHVLGVLPGLGSYDSDSSKENSDNSSEEDVAVPARDLLGRVIHQQ
ncbi:hypothetical protein BIW11_01186 [Tropilaelaps mercedesae]|uniref:FAM192A/Fyv6 N-terminal domain-containing protein n=1 Tax=Tropilaelaps mercedesae TaxID=418985 RepID=A0A1V9XIC2_9ACAR|nr:hypothetical protein BIW11_01186 [Tropilaelaps mercedesae]